MNKYSLFFLVILVLFGPSCRKEFNDCEGYFPSNKDVLDSCLGDVEFNAGTNFWVNRDSLNSHFVLVNDSGYRVSYQKNYHTITNIGTKKISSNGAPTKLPCGAYEYHYNYVNLSSEQYEYMSNQSPFRINYSRYVDFLSYQKDSMPRIKGIEHLALQIYHYRSGQYNLAFQVVFDSSHILPFQQYQDSLVLGKKSFHKVYTAMVDTSKIDKGFIQPIGIYFNKEIGFIGYFLNSGEKWIID